MQRAERIPIRSAIVGDRYVHAEIGESMDLEANLRMQRISRALAACRVEGVREVAQGNISCLVEYDADLVSGQTLAALLAELDADDQAAASLATRVIEVPVFFADPWTAEVMSRFRENHQTPALSDIEFAAQVNGFERVDQLIDAIVARPFIVAMTGFLPCTPFCFQLVEEDRQIEMPKYLRPRTETPAGAFCWGGSFAAVNPFASPGGYQLLGRSPAPMIDFEGRLPDFSEEFAFMRAGDIVLFRPIGAEEYDAVRAQVTEGSFRHRVAAIDFALDEYFANADGAVDRYRSAIDGD